MNYKELQKILKGYRDDGKIKKGFKLNQKRDALNKVYEKVVLSDKLNKVIESMSMRRKNVRSRIGKYVSKHKKNVLEKIPITVTIVSIGKKLPTKKKL